MQGIAIDESGVAWSTDDEAFDKVVEQAADMRLGECLGIMFRPPTPDKLENPDLDYGYMEP